MSEYKTIGQASSKVCPNAGVAYLHPSNSEVLVVETVCKGWRCKSCRDRKLGFVASLQQYGLSHLEGAFLVSVTFVARGPKRGRAVNCVDAEYAEKAYKAWVRILKRDKRFAAMATFRVVELTERKQIHFHLLMGNVDFSTDRCRKRERYDWKVAPYPGCGCLQCTLSGYWYRVTKDSWVVDAERIYDPEGSSWYLCKYLRKGLYGAVREELEERGYSRRYFASNNWPRGVQMRRRGTVDKAWVRHSFEYGRKLSMRVLKESEKHPLMEQVGTDMALKFKEKARRKRVAAIHAKVLAGGRSGGG